MLNRGKQTILYVDDTESNRYIGGRALRQAGFTIVEATCGEEALRLVADQPDLVVLDIKLPDMSGNLVREKIKADPTTRSIPILHLTATYKDDPEMAANLVEGAEGYLTQPVEPAVLVATVKALLRTRRAEAALLYQAQNWQTTFDAVGDGICLVDFMGVIVQSNRAFQEYLGLSAEELQNREWAELMCSCFADWDSSLPQRVHSSVEQVQSSGQRVLTNVTSGDRAFRLSLDPLLDEEGEFLGAIQVLVDITEQVHAQLAAHDAEQFTQATIDSLKSHVAVIDNSGKIVTANDSWQKFTHKNFSFGINNLIPGGNYFQFCEQDANSEYAATFAREIRSVLAGNIDSFEHEYPCPTPEGLFWFLGRVTRFQQGETTWGVISQVDITARKQMDEALRESQQHYRTLTEVAPQIIWTAYHKG